MGNSDLGVKYFWDWIKRFWFMKHFVSIDPGIEMDKTVYSSKPYIACQHTFTQNLNVQPMLYTTFEEPPNDYTHRKPNMRIFN